MKSGVNFFPCCRPEVKSAAQFLGEALALSEQADALGYESIKMVEHYFSPYGGYSPSPLIFLAAAAQRTEHARLVTGAAVPAFNHPLKLAAELAMVDCISGGRLDVGFARAFLPHEFDAFGVSMEDSRARFEEGIEAILRLWCEESVDFDGRFHSFEGVSLLPKPVQSPHPPVRVAAVSTPESFTWAGEQGFGLMVVPYLSDFENLATLLESYRGAYRGARGSEPPPVSIVLHMLAAATDAQAREDARSGIEQYVSMAKDATVAWSGRSSPQYRGYDKVYSTLEAMTFDRVLDEGRALIGSPETIGRRLEELLALFGPMGLECNVLFGELEHEKAERSIELYGREVLPELARRDAALAV
ncbi:MAG: LLM class flavin-dependent oxidoreductase [Solirubrobacterales bacterium]|nr:LLM class flavin-dependent oxidoreductase [Solirubrobacterales bacterium]